MTLDGSVTYRSSVAASFTRRTGGRATRRHGPFSPTARASPPGRFGRSAPGASSTRRAAPPGWTRRSGTSGTANPSARESS